MGQPGMSSFALSQHSLSQRRTSSNSSGSSGTTNTTNTTTSSAQQDKCRKFFQHAEPTFAVSVPARRATELQFLDNFDPGKDSVVRKKAREWVNRNKEKGSTGGSTGGSAGGNPRGKVKGVVGAAAAAAAAAGRKEEEERRVMVRGKKGKGMIDLGVIVGAPRTVAAESVDPFGLLPNVGRNFDHIIKYFLSRSCPEEVPCTDDKYADETKLNRTVITFQRDNTVLGNMANTELTFVLWLYATVTIRDGMFGIHNQEEVNWLCGKALQMMQAAVQNAMKTEVYPDHLLNALSCITATALFGGMFTIAKTHRDAMITMFSLRGRGDVLATLKSVSPFTAKASQWCEMLVNAQNAEIPRLPYYLPQSDPLPANIVAEAAKRASTTLSKLPKLAEPLPYIVQLLQQIGVGWSRPPPHTKMDSFIIQPMYDAEYTILSTLDAQKSKNHGYTPIEVLLTETFQLYFWTTTRRLPPQTRLSEVLISRLMQALLPLLLETSAEHVYEAVSIAVPFDIGDSECPTATADHYFRFLSHPREANNAITWSLALGALVTAPLASAEQAWFKTHFILQLRAMGFDSSEAGWRAFLDLFPPTDGFPWANMTGMHAQFAEWGLGIGVGFGRATASE